MTTTATRTTGAAGATATPAQGRVTRGVLVVAANVSALAAWAVALIGFVLYPAAEAKDDGWSGFAEFLFGAGFAVVAAIALVVTLACTAAWRRSGRASRAVTVNL